MLFNNEWINNEIKEEIKKYLETIENEHKTTPNLWNTAKAVMRGKFIAIQAYLKKTKISNDLTLHLQGLEEQQQTKPRARRRKERIKIQAKLNDIQTKRTI